MTFDTETAVFQVDSGIEQVKVRVLPDGRMTSDNAARYLGRAPKTLAMWRLQGLGPRWVKVGSRIFYFRNDLDALVRAGSSTKPTTPASANGPPSFNASSKKARLHRVPPNGILHQDHF